MEKIKLEEAIKVDGVLVNEITLRKPKVKDLVVTGKNNLSDIERTIQLIANLAEIPVESVEAIELTDFMKINNWLQNFLSLPTAQS